MYLIKNANLQKLSQYKNMSSTKTGLSLYFDVSYKISHLITKKYSTSFSLATSLLEKEVRYAIYAIYGFVRLADEIVDTFHDYDKEFLLGKLDKDLNYALENGISDNPILASFADTVRKYGIDKKYIDAFMDSMRFDLTKLNYKNTNELDQYIYGSANVVGLMCLRVFCKGQNELFDKLEYPAERLGSAFQKVNFLRDLKDDINQLGRSYFPEIEHNTFNENTKALIEKSIDKDFKEAHVGIKQLPGRSKFAVALAYYYYTALFEKIRKTKAETVIKKRIRIPDFKKYLIILKVWFIYKTKMI